MLKLCNYIGFIFITYIELVYSSSPLGESLIQTLYCFSQFLDTQALDQRIFITFNPFNVYVTQADTKPGCVLRPSNVVSLLQKERKLITDDEVQACKNGFNTWAFVGKMFCYLTFSIVIRL